MTDERKNELWAMLTPEERSDIRDWAAEASGSFDFYEGYEGALEAIFGHHNLNAQADVETSQEKPLDVAERVKTSTKEDACFTSDTQNYNTENHIVGKENNVDYAQYRLDLAKEIVVAMIGEKAIGYGDIADIAVEIANEIVKRLKETEE